MSLASRLLGKFVELLSPYRRAVRRRLKALAARDRVSKVVTA